MKDGVLFSGNFDQGRIMKKEIEKKWLKKELKSLFKSEGRPETFSSAF